MHTGFTGTRKGLSERQRNVLALLLRDCTFHHGDCEGADTEAHGIARENGCSVHLHPPINDSARAFCEADVSEEPKEYLVRNHDIVDFSDVLIACPRQKKEQLRSGTWATIRYARKAGKSLMIVFPDGTHGV
tara:strand:- start:3830 stop:4225 length:396 start_codon:yes stop_codon:yes gene_type:complete